MAKFYGKVGYAETEETSPGVWTETITEKYYYGDVLKHYKSFDKSEYLNDNLNINNEFSIVADPYAIDHFYKIRYIDWMGTLWKVNSVTLEYPRLILNVGGVYNGEQA